ncbi:alpha/beta hydrolase [Sphingomonas psychrotolerans]|uniref:Alpha/beta hydrolase n=1 Tax=Sphingomonas psychrotolerans TaxID=1327635 RepID=A0ABU3N9B6_9SPHN|nr:alpha/beta hydrolase [Sphingomonas psychrotolerans]MDT8761077.1 alpha/beta hydrolase [Sphingomonas psychrotolerans]
MKITRRTMLAGSLAATAPLPALARAPAPIERFPIWPGSPPGGAGLTVRDEVVKRSANGAPDDIAWPHVAIPMLNVVPAANPNGGAILMIPGGGYARVALGREGSSIARMFAGRGFTTFELLYRLPHDGWAAGPDAPLQDAQRAMRLIRAQASRWKVDPVRIAVAGFSAGGHLAARLASRAGLETYAPVDDADRQAARPAVAGLFFPVITLADPTAHAQSRRELLGSDVSAGRIRRFSAETDLPADMPPTFVAHAADDPAVKPANSLLMFTALQTAKIPSELHIFEKGGHGLPLVEESGAAHPWPALFERFARRHGLQA